MEFFKQSKLSTIILLIVAFGILSEAIPVKRSTQSMAFTESLAIRLSVLQDVVNGMESNMTKYQSLCRISKAAKMVYEQTLNNTIAESGHLVAAEQINDICNLMITHTIPDLNCNTTTSSINIIDSLCDELAMYTAIKELTDPVLEQMKKQIQTIPEKTSFVEEIIEELPESVQAVICTPYGC